MAASVASNQYAQGSGSATLPTLTAGRIVLAVIYAPGTPQVLVSIGTGAVTGSWVFLGLVNSPLATGSPGDLEFWAFCNYSSQSSPTTFTPVMAGSASAYIGVAEVQGITFSGGLPQVGSPMKYNDGASGTAITAPTVTLATQDEFILTAVMQSPAAAPTVNVANGYTYLDSSNFFGFRPATSSTFVAPTFSGVSSGPWVAATLTLYAADNLPFPPAGVRARVPSFTVSGVVKAATARLRGSAASYTVRTGTGVILSPPAARARLSARSTLSAGDGVHLVPAKGRLSVPAFKVSFGVSAQAARSAVRARSFPAQKAASVVIPLFKGRLAATQFTAAGNRIVSLVASEAQARVKVPTYTVTTNHAVSLHFPTMSARAKAAQASVHLGFGVTAIAARVRTAVAPFRAAGGTGVQRTAAVLKVAARVPPFAKRAAVTVSPAQVSGRVPPFTVSRSSARLPAAGLRASVPAFTISTPTGLAAQVLIAYPYSDGVTVFYPEYSAVGTTGWTSLDPSQQLEGSEA